MAKNTDDRVDDFIGCYLFVVTKDTDDEYLARCFLLIVAKNTDDRAEDLIGCCLLFMAKDTDDRVENFIGCYHLV